jgi:hypothetical protein
VSRLDEHTQEVAAFEELVGCHGGLVRWLTDLGQRRDARALELTLAEAIEESIEEAERTS